MASQLTSPEGEGKYIPMVSSQHGWYFLSFNDKSSQNGFMYKHIAILTFSQLHWHRIILECIGRTLF